VREGRADGRSGFCEPVLIYGKTVLLTPTKIKNVKISKTTDVSSKSGEKKLLTYFPSRDPVVSPSELQTKQRALFESTNSRVLREIKITSRLQHKKHKKTTRMLN